MLMRNKVEVEFDKLFRDYGYGTTTWSPLASGILTGKYNDGAPKNARLNREELGWLKDRILNENNLKRVAELKAVADDLNTTRANLALAWCLKNPHVSTVITGATKVEQLKQNLASLDVVPLLTQEVMNKIDVILDNSPLSPEH
jgi:aryl-alcohol dehydrogenase-like predicted oxidoreductase